MSVSRQSRELKLQREFAPKGQRRKPWKAGLRFVSRPGRSAKLDPRKRRQQLRPKWKLSKATVKANQRGRAAAKARAARQ